MEQKSKSKFIHIRQINQNNVNEIYQKQFNRFLFDFSDEVNIDGKIYGNKGEEKFKRFCLGYLKNEKGEPNFKQITVNGIKDGFKLTENDFVEYELEQIVDYPPKGLTEKKQLKTYKEYLEKRLSELNKSSETTNHFDNNLPLKNYELFFVHYKNFFINIEINDIKEFYNTCNDLKEVEIADISYRAKQEVEKLLNTPNNNAERLIKKLQRETTELIELRKKVYKTHKINNAQTKDHSNLLGAFQFATIGFNEFLDAILPLVENDSNNTNKLSEAEQKEVLNTIQVDFIEFFRDAKLTKDEQINFIENQINGMYISFPETPRTDFFIERLKRLKEAIAKPQQETKTDAPTKKELDLKDFFVNTNEPTIIEIKNKFKNSADKDLAMLIYRLTELELVEIIPNNKKKSRKHFISALTGQPNKDMSYINRVLQNYDTTIQTNNNGKTYEITDNNYISVKNKLNDILNPKVV